MKRTTVFFLWIGAAIGFVYITGEWVTDVARLLLGGYGGGGH